MKNKITIEYEWGSPTQKQVWDNVIKQAIEVLFFYPSQKHKGNKYKISYSTKENEQ